VEKFFDLFEAREGSFSLFGFLLLFYRLGGKYFSEVEPWSPKTRSVLAVRPSGGVTKQFSPRKYRLSRAQYSIL